MSILVELQTSNSSKVMGLYLRKISFLIKLQAFTVKKTDFTGLTKVFYRDFLNNFLENF